MTYEELGNYLLQRTNVGCYIVVLHQKYDHEYDYEYRRCVEYFVHTPEDVIEYDFDFNEGEQCIVVNGIFDLDSAELYGGSFDIDSGEIKGLELILKEAVKDE